jgi:hypothetical protein
MSKERREIGRWGQSVLMAIEEPHTLQANRTGGCEHVGRRQRSLPRQRRRVRLQALAQVLGIGAEEVTS